MIRATIRRERRQPEKRTMRLRNLATMGDKIGLNFSDRTRQRRLRDRGSRDWTRIADILDAGFIAHVAFCVDHQPIVIPTMYGRDSQSLYLHGSVASHMLRELAAGIQACVTVTLVDGL